jgi:signal transduction histidine kinase
MRVSPFKCLSIISALVSAALLAGVFTLATGPWWQHSGGAIASMLFGCLVLALFIGGMFWIAGAALDGELQRLTAHLGSLEEGRAEPQPFVSRFGLTEIAQAVSRITGPLRSRLHEVASHRRELEVQVLVAEAQRRHLEAILNSISDAVIVTDAFNEIALANEAAAQLLAFDLGPSVRRPIDQVIHDATLIKYIKDAREGGQGQLRRHVEHRMGHNGSAAIYDVTLACVASSATSRGSKQAAAGVVTILRDITREKEIAEMKSDFVSSVSHELRTPLASIKAYLEMLIDGEAQDEKTRAEFYGIIQGEANRLSRLIDNILNISRIESGVVKVQREHVALPQLIKEAVDIMQPQARAKKIELSDQPAPVYFQVFADRDMILQALLNLLGNAVKYTPPGGRITTSVAVDEQAKLVNVSVSDTGVGVPPEDIAHVFDKFYRVPAHKKLAKGTGLGLNLVKHVIETVHGGQIRVESAVNQGSTFTFALPIADNE